MMITQAVLLEKNILRVAKTCFITMPRAPTTAHCTLPADDKLSIQLTRGTALKLDKSSFAWPVCCGDWFGRATY
jgi:hypothetical protein